MNGSRLVAGMALYLSCWAVFAGAHSYAVPAVASVILTPPVGSAKTFQVTEIVYEAGNGSQPGPVRETGSMVFKVRRPDRFRIEWKPLNSGPGSDSTPSLYISDGTTLTIVQGKHYKQTPAARAEWPFPLVGLLNNAPPGGPVKAITSQRMGRPVLLTIQDSPMGRTELTFDPTTHLLLSSSMYIKWKKKTIEVMRTEYTNWTLNRLLPASTFRFSPPPGATKLP